MYEKIFRSRSFQLELLCVVYNVWIQEKLKNELKMFVLRRPMSLMGNNSVFSVRFLFFLVSLFCLVV